MFTYLSNSEVVNVIANTLLITNTVDVNWPIAAPDATTPEIDITGAVGPIMITVIAKTGGTGTTTVQPVMRVSTTSDYTDVPAASILSATTGLATTFSTLGTGASVQTVALNREHLDKYVAVKFSGMTSRTITVTVSFLTQYSGQTGQADSSVYGPAPTPIEGASPGYDPITLLTAYTITSTAVEFVGTSPSPYVLMYWYGSGDNTYYVRPVVDGAFHYRFPATIPDISALGVDVWGATDDTHSLSNYDDLAYSEIATFTGNATHTWGTL